MLLAWLGVLLRPTPTPPDQRLWTFGQTHADALLDPSPAGPSPLDVYEQRTGRTVQVEVLDGRAMELRLLALTRAGVTGAALPDVVQFELASAAKFLDPATGRVPLEPYDDGAIEGVLPARAELWSRGGKVYGLPLDVHPTMLAYRVDLWTAAGVDPTAAATWPKFRRLAERYVDYWSTHGHPERRALELSTSSSEHLTLLLQQRGLSPRDLSDPKLLETVAFVAELATVARPTSRGHGRWAADFVAGDVGALWMPDWRVAYLEEAAPSLAGRVALMPLPRFDAGDADTASWGGTMLAVPTGINDADAAAELARFVATSPEILAARARQTTILPPLPDRWGAAATDADFFANGPARARFAEVAAGVRSPRVDPAFLAAAGHLAVVLNATTRDVASGRHDVAERLRRRLASASEDVSRYAERAARAAGTPVAAQR